LLCEIQLLELPHVFQISEGFLKYFGVASYQVKGVFDDALEVSELLVESIVVFDDLL
jgi:hypothetical protein